jgi:iron(III) transport system ATP-binding protein
MTSLTVNRLGKSLGGTTVLRDISFSVPHATRLALVGASGSGKSTILRLIAGFDRVDSGRISIGEHLVSSTDTYVAAHRRGVGYVAQDGALFPHLTVRRNIGFGLSTDPERRQKTIAAAELVELDTRMLDRYPHELSGGQQQRASLARALAPAPRIILLDETFSALDTGLRAQTRQAVLAVLEQAQMTTVLVTHDQHEALTFGHAVGILRDGVLDQLGTPAEVFDAPSTPYVASFLGDTLTLPATRRASTAETALGTIGIRHDHSVGSAAVSIMVRPSQLSIVNEPGDPNATIVALAATGQYVQVTADLADGVCITIPVPSHAATGIRIGSPVRIRIDGGGVLY